MMDQLSALQTASLMFIVMMMNTVTGKKVAMEIVRRVAGMEILVELEICLVLDV